MPYGKSGDISTLKKKIEEQMPGVNVDNLSQNDMQNMLLNEINKDKTINPSVKEKINKGDIEGLREELINHLSKNKSGESEKLVKMLKNNDMDGLKNQLLGMLMGNLGSQKKNEIANNEPDEGLNDSQEFTPPVFDDKVFLNTIMGKVFEGSKSDNRIAFLNSMRPLVSDKRQKSIDDCVKILSVITFFEKFTNKVGN